MKKYLRGRKLFVLLLLLGFLAGMCAEKLWGISGYEVMAAPSGERLSVVFYDDTGRKVCVREDAVLPISELFRMEIPLEKWEKEQTGLVEIKVSFEDGTEKRNRVRIQRKALHKEEK